PEDPDAMAGLSDIESLAGGINSVQSSPAENTEVVKSPPKPSKSGHTTALARRLLKPDQIDESPNPFHKVFVESKAIASADFDACWPAQDLHATPTKVVEPFLQALADKGILPVDKALKMILDKHRVPYLPIERYDVDIELARTFPSSTLKRWCVLPFDRM